jgi:Fe2+ or Zn2+ uptake regulation protein
MPKQNKPNNVVYQGGSIWARVNEKVLHETGEIQITGEIIHTDDVIRKTPRVGFEITYMMYLFELFDKLGGQKYKVVKYILEHRSKAENILIITIDELAKKAKVSRQTVFDTLKVMEEAGLIARRTGAIMINAKLAHRGDDKKERYLLQKFETFEVKEETTSPSQKTKEENNFNLKKLMAD